MARTPWPSSTHHRLPGPGDPRTVRGYFWSNWLQISLAASWVPAHSTTAAGLVQAPLLLSLPPPPTTPWMQGCSATPPGNSLQCCQSSWGRNGNSHAIAAPSLPASPSVSLTAPVCSAPAPHPKPAPAAPHSPTHPPCSCFLLSPCLGLKLLCGAQQTWACSLSVVRSVWSHRPHVFHMCLECCGASMTLVKGLSE